MKNLVLSIASVLLLSNTISAQTIDSKISNALKQAKAGEIVMLPDFLKPDFKKITYKQTVVPGPQFLISDDPEYIRIPEAIAMQEVVAPGAVRLYVYNVNGVREPQKITRKINSVIKNLGKEDLHLRFLKFTSQKPSTNYFQIGKQGLDDYFRSQEVNHVKVIKPGQVAVIDDKLEKAVVKYDELVHGFYEFVIDQPAEISVLQTSPNKSSIKAYADIDTIIPNSHANAGRGIFPISNYKIAAVDTITTDQGVQQIIIADGIDDPWITGTIGEEKKDAKNAGNYGVMYDTSVKWKSTDGKGLALVTWNSRSADNQWCGGMALTMEVYDEKGNKTIQQFPSNQLVTRAAPEAILIKIFKPDPTKEIQEIKLTYSPPGASCLPTPLVFIPIDL